MTHFHDPLNNIQIKLVIFFIHIVSYTISTLYITDFKHFITCNESGHGLNLAFFSSLLVLSKISVK